MPAIVALLIWLACCAPNGVLAAEKAARWADERTTDAFVFHSQFPLDPHRKILGELTQLQSDLQQSLGVGPAQGKIHLYLFRDKANYRRYLKRYLPGAPNRRALFVKHRGRAMVFAYRSRDFDVDLRHETTHALLHATLPMVPLWLDEGLAEYFEVPHDQRVRSNPHLNAVKWNVRLGLNPKLKALEDKRQLKEMGRGDYRNAWAWVHFMLHGPPPARRELLAYLADVQSNTPPGRIGQRLRKQIPGVEKKIVAHFKQW